MKLSAVFIDRDGVLNEEADYLSDPKKLSLIHGAADAIYSLNTQTVSVIVVSNQSGVARGYFLESQIKVVEVALEKELAEQGAHIDGWYYCPHLSEGSVAEYAIECDCRKPKPGLLIRAAQERGIELVDAVMIGDKASDIAAGHAVGARTILVRTGQGEREWAGWREEFKPSYVAKDLADAVQWLLSVEREGAH